MVAVAIAVVAPYLAPLALGALGITATATAVAIATAVIGVTLSLAASFAFRALGIGAIPAAKAQVGPPQVFRQAITDSFIVYGKRRVGGLLVFFFSRQDGSGNHFRYFVIACAGHQCKGLVQWMLNDDEVSTDGSGKVVSGAGKWANNSWLWFVRGTNSDVTNSTFDSELGTYWGPEHKGLGVAKIYAKFQLTDGLVEAGMPNITAIIEGRDEVLDTRTGIAGYTRNAALIFYDWLQMPREEGGFGAFADEIPDTSWINAQANVCDETVDSETRYSIDAVITTGAPPSQVRDAMIVNMAGSYTFSGGKHLMRPGYWVPVSATLSEDDLAGAIQVSPFLTSDASANEVQGTYISPQKGYQGAPFTTQTIAATDVRQIDLDLAFTTSIKQANRVASIMLKRAQAEKTVVWPMNISGLKNRALDTVQLDSSRYGLSNYAFVISNWSLSAEYGVVQSLREENAEIYTDPAPVTPVTPPTVPAADVVITTSQLIELINTSEMIGMTASLSSTGAVTISNHTRRYSDIGSKSVTGTSGTPIASGGTSGQFVFIYYDDPTRAGGAVTYNYLVLSTTGGDASSTVPSTAHPGRHFVWSGKVPASGSTGGGSDPGSGGGSGGGCVTIDTLIEMWDGSYKPAGDLVRYNQIRTLPEVEGAVAEEMGVYHIIHVEVLENRPVFLVTQGGHAVRATAKHRFWTDEGWKTAEELGSADGNADVVKISVVAEAQTYNSAGLISHNLKPADPD